MNLKLLAVIGIVIVLVFLLNGFGSYLSNKAKKNK